MLSRTSKNRSVNDNDTSIIGFKVTKQERDAYLQVAKTMAATRLPHPELPGQVITFLPQGAGLGKLVRIAFEQYLLYFQRCVQIHNAVMQKAAAAQQQPAIIANKQGQQLSQEQIAQIKAMMGRTQELDGGGNGLAA